MSSRNTIGRRVREERENRGLTQAELASLAGILPTDLTSLEEGTWRPVDHGTVARLARALKCAFFDLLWWHPDLK